MGGESPGEGGKQEEMGGGGVCHNASLINDILQRTKG